MDSFIEKTIRDLEKQMKEIEAHKNVEAKISSGKLCIIRTE